MNEIPRGRVLPIMRHEVEKRNGIMIWSRSTPVRDDIGGLRQCAFEIADRFDLDQESVERGLRRFFNESKKYVRFATVDQWFVGLGITEVWHTELGDIYEAA